MGENAIQGMKEFKSSYFYRAGAVPEQSILIFDEAQRAWDAAKLGKGFSEPEGLFRVGERIFANRGYAALIGLYGNGQVIYTGEEAGLSLWKAALEEHEDWSVVAAEGLAEQLQGLGTRRIVERDVFLPVSLVMFGGDYIRQDGKWVARGSRYSYDVRKGNYRDPDTIVENNYRVLLTRARKEMVLWIPKDRVLDETYQYFLDMGMDQLAV